MLCDVTLRMIEGELYQLTKNGDADITEDEHFDIIRRKTAYLFGGCAQIGGMLGKRQHGAGTGAARYGFNLGIAFQLVDDLLDFTGDATALGKPVGGDLREGKMTLPLIHLLQQDEEAAATIVRDIIAAATVSRRAVERAARAAQRAPLDRLRATAARPSSPSARRSRCTCFRPAPSAMRCWRCPITSCRATDSARTNDDRRTSRLRHPVPSLRSPEERLAELRDAIRHHEERYYIHNDPEIADEEFDRAAARARAARGASIPISSPPIRRPSASPAGRSKGFATVEHLEPMLSLDNAYNDEELRASTSACARAPAWATRRSPTSPS